MQFKDEGVLELKAKTDLDKRLDEINERAKVLKSTLKDIEKNGGKGNEEWKKYRVELDNTNASAKKLAKEIKSMDVGKLTIQQLENHAKQLAKEMKNADRSSQDYVKNAKRLGEVEKELAKAKKQAQELKGAGEDLAKPTLWNKITGGIKGIGVAFKAIFVLEIISWVVDLGKAIFNTTAQFEKYEKTLESTLGSQAEAKKTMAALKDLAKELPQTVEQLTEGYIKLANRGLRPGGEEMKRLTDFSLKSGKSITDLSEAIMDINNQERWSEFGVKVKKSGDKIITTIGGVEKSFANTEQGALEMAVALGSVNGTMGLAEKQMDSLGGMASNVEDGFTALLALLGEELKPVFKFLLKVLSEAINYLSILVKTVVTVITTFKNFGTAAINIFKNTGEVIKGFFTGVGKSIKQILSGNFSDLGKNFDGMKNGFIKAGKEISKASIKTKKAVGEIWKVNQKAVELEGKKGGAAFGKGSNEELKKADEKRAKDREEALKKIDELENDAYLDFIKRTKGEVEAEKVALQQKFEQEKKAILASLANQADKDKQVKLLKEKLDRTIEDLEKKHQQITNEIIERWTDDEYVQKTKKAQNFANTELELARKNIKDKQKLADVEEQINEHLRKELATIAEEKTSKANEEADKRAKHEFDTSIKKLNHEKFIMEQEHKAEIAMLDGIELANRNNKAKLIQLQKERLDTELRQLKEKMAFEQRAEELKIKQDIKDETERSQALSKLNDSYRVREKEETAKTEAAKTELVRKASEERNKVWKGASDAFGALLKGDLTAFASHLDGLVKGEKAAWQERLNENMAKFEAIGQMAIQAANFLNDLTQKRVAKELEMVKAEYEQKKALLDANLSSEKDAIEAVEQQKKDLKANYAEQVKTIKEANEKSINDAERFYKELSSADNKEKFEEAVSLAQDEAEEKIKQAKKAQEEAEEAARSERDEKINSAEAARDAEIAAINARADIDSATKKKLIAETKAKAEFEIESAKREAELKIKLSEDEKDKKIADAKAEKEAKIKLLEQLRTATKEQAKELLDAAKADAKAKVAEAEKEKQEKLKILEQEKQKRISSKKELERQLAEEDKKAKNKEAQLKYKAAMAQWKTDQVSAFVNGALATIKALASGFFPLNLVFAALTAVATGIQIAAIRKNKPAAPQTFAYGGFAPMAGIGGMTSSGPRHGSKYGEDGFAIINRRTGQEDGEMEGEEGIVGRDQTKANLPLLQMMWAKSRRGDKTPIIPMNRFRPLAFETGGMMPSLSGGREMFLFGGKKKKQQADTADYDTSGADGGETGDAEAAHGEAKKQGQEQLKLLTEVREELKSLNEKMTINTKETVGATQAVERAVKDGNSHGKMDAMIGLIGSLGKKAA